ncbi:MAG: hypothetical protein OYK82_14585 [Gammaproteobacteria bacterium]|nr:hypothetical protein [Gammaproteobacteria bacterium]
MLMMPIVNPDILVWARTTAGLTLDDAVGKVGITDARGVAASDRLALLERGEQESTRPVLVRMAKQYRRPLLAFHLAAPPSEIPIPVTISGRSPRCRPPGWMLSWRRLSGIIV